MQVIRIELTRCFQPKSEESAAEVDLASELALLGQTSDAIVMPKTRRHAKTDVRFWKKTILRWKRGTEEVSKGNRNWRKQVAATPLDIFAVEAIQKWKLRYINAHADSP